MTQIIAGHNLGLLDGSHTLLNRNDLTGLGTIGHGEQAYANVSNGNLLMQEWDVFLPSLGEDFNFVRTYNSRGMPNGGGGWRFSTDVTLQAHQDKRSNGSSLTSYLLTYGDGSALEFVYDAGRALWVSTDGAGAFETLEVLPKTPPQPGGAAYLVTRADRTVYRFDKDFKLLSTTDANGVATSFDYEGGRVVRIHDDTGHLLSLAYKGGKLARVIDELGQVLVEYEYTADMLTKVTDRSGHVTRYGYECDNLLSEITLPSDDDTEQRTVSFTYARVSWNDHPHFVTDFDKGDQFVLAQIVDATGAVTSFEYDFQFGQVMAANDRDLAFKTLGGTVFQGGTTRVVDALGNARAYSNEAEYKAWRLANGYYETYVEYNSKTDGPALAEQTRQANLIRYAQSVVYTYDANGQLTKVTDELKFETVYAYDAQGNLTSITDANGFGALNSDSAYFRDLRKDLGYVDLSGNGKLAANLTTGEKAALLERFTSRFTYDARGNVETARDNAGNVTTYTYTAFNKIETIRTPLGHVTAYEYDARQNLIRRTDALGNIVDFEYDADGNLTRQIVYLDKTDLRKPGEAGFDEAKSQITAYSYDAFGNNTRIVDAEGNLTRNEYDHFGNLRLSVDGRGGQTFYAYDADDRLVSMTDPEGHTTSYAYDAVGNQIAVTDASGHTITRVFDKNNLLLATIDPSAAPAAFAASFAASLPAGGRTSTFDYDVLGNGTRATDAEGRVTTYTYDAHRQLVEIRSAEVLDGQGQWVTHTETFAYDGRGNVVASTDRNGNVTQFLFTENGQIRRMTDAIGNVTQYTYDSDLRQVEVVVGLQLAAGLRRVLKFDFDDSDQLERESDTLGTTAQYEYDAAGNVIALTDANANTTNFVYDRNNRVLHEIRPEVTDPVTLAPVRYVVSHRYDANGNEVSTTDENGHTTTLSYDKDNRLVLIAEANGVKTVFGYDSRDNRTTVAIGVEAHFDAASGHVVIDDAGRGQVTTYRYDEFNDMVSMTDGVGNALVGSDEAVYQRMRAELGMAQLVENLSEADKALLLARYTDRFGYDQVGNQVSRTDHLGRVTETEYDALNRVVSVTEGAGTAVQRTTTYRYDGNDNVVRSTSALDQTQSAVYDAMNRLTRQTDRLGVTTTYAYDNVGNVLEQTDAAGTVDARTTQYVYDLRNRVTDEIDPLLHKRSYAYDAVGNRLKVTDARGGETQFFYDALNRNVRILDPLTFETRYQYDGAGNRIAVVDPRGGITRFDYDPGNRNIQIEDAEGRKTRFDYDTLGNTVTQTTAYGTPEAEVTQYLYDAEGNLRQVTDAEHGVSSGRFDAVYNMTASTDANGHTTTYAFDALNRQLSVTDALNQTTRYSYDALDNVLTQTDPLGRQRKFAYDANDRLIVETDPLGVETRYGYDSVGNQVSITRAANTDSQRVTTLSYDKGDRLLSEVDPIGYARAYSNAPEFVAWRLAQVPPYAAAAADPLAPLTPEVEAILDTQRTTYAYDAEDNLTAVTDANGHTTAYFYDLNGRVSSIVDPLGYARAYSNDPEFVAWRLAQLPPYPAAAADPLAPLTPEVEAILDTQRTAYAYDRNGNRTQVTDARGNTTTTYFNAENEVALTVDPSGFASEYAYDANGNVISRTDYLALLAAPVDPEDLPATKALLAGMPTRITEYKFDRLNRLTEEIRPQVEIGTWQGGALLTQTATPTTTTTYDAVGNVLSRTDANGHAVSYAYDAANRVVARLTAEGYLSTYAYDKAGNLTIEKAYKRVYALSGGEIPAPQAGDAPRTTRSAYDANDRLVRRADAAGVFTTFEYDAVGNQTAEVEASGTGAARRRETVYDVADRAVQTTDAAGTVTRYALDAVGNVLTRFENAGDPVAANRRETSFAYDALDRIVLSTDALLNRTKYEYDATGNLLARTGALGLPEERIERFEYDANDRLAVQVNGEGERTEFTYDAVGRRIRITLAPGTPEQRVNAFEYDDDDRMVAEIDGENMRTEYRYDAAGNAVEVIQAAGVVGEERRTRMTYSADDRLLSVRDPLGHTTNYGYDDLGNQVSITDANGTVTANTFDVLGRLLTNTVGVGGPHGGIRTTNTYDAFGNVLTSTRAWADGTDARTTTYEYDKLNRQTRVTDGEGFSTVFTYDAFGNLKRIERGAYTGSDTAKQDVAHVYQTDLAYDGMNRLLSTTDGSGNVVRNTYDALGNRLTQTTGIATGADLAHESTLDFDYDAAGRMIERRSPTGGVATLKYDEAGNLTEQKTLQSGSVGGIGTDTPVWSVKRYEYDGNGRVVASFDSYGTKTEYRFDKVGNQTAIVYAAGTGHERTVGFEYDLDNNQRAEIDALGNRTEYAYDQVGNLVKKTNALGQVTRFYYDAFNRLQGRLDARNFLTQFTNDAAGNVTETRVFMNAVAGPVADGAPMPAPVADVLRDRVTLTEYDRAGRVVKQTVPDRSYKTFEYDSTDKLLKKTEYGAPDRMSLTALPASRVVSWVYDDSGRMVQFTNVDGVIETYVYDAANNKISETLSNPTPPPADPKRALPTDPDRTTVYTYDLDNRLLTQRFDPAGLNLLQTLVYDKAGNAVAKTDQNLQVTSTTYDLENRAKTLTDPLSHVLSYDYDLLGNLFRVTDARGNAYTTVYDENNRATQISQEVVQVGRWVAGAFAWADVAPTTRSVYDEVGNLRQATDANGNVTTYWYDATGNRIAERNGAGAVRAYTYNALGELLSATQDMKFHGEPINLLAPPVLSSDPEDLRIATNELDLAGRVTKTTYSQIEVTALNGTGGSTPGSTTSTVAPQESSVYDAYGNLVKSVDRNNNAKYAYYDLRGQQVAAVDEAGYLIETDYDDQGNIVQQRSYKTPLAGPFSSAVRPAPPDASPVTADRIYDAASRLIEDISAPVHTESGDVRVVTRLSYDAAGRLTSKTLGYATIDSGGTRTAGASPRAEYYYYDAAGRRVAVVTAADRVLNEFGYDANGNLTLQKRYFAPVGLGVDLASGSTNLAVLQANVAPDATKDETTVFVYDSANRRISQTDLMGVGSGDDLTTLTGYDESGNVTYRQDPDGYAQDPDGRGPLGVFSLNRYDGAGLLTESVLPNGAHSHVEYDTGGLKVKAWVGGAAGLEAPLATDVSAQLVSGPGAPVVVSWEVSGSNVTSWIAYDTVSHSALTGTPSPLPGQAGDYRYATSGRVGSGALSAELPSNLGGTIYFRVMTMDTAKNVAWTQEQSLVVPPSIASITIGQTASGSSATITFSAPVKNGELQVAGESPVPGTGSNGSPATGYSSWTFQFSGAPDDQVRILWTAGGVNYASDYAALFQAQGAHVDAGNGWVSWPVPTDGVQAVGDGQFALVDGVLQADIAFMGAVNGTNVTVSTALRDPGGQFSMRPTAADGVTPLPTSPGGTSEYDILYGTLSGQTHDASILNAPQQRASAVFANYNYNSASPPAIVSTTYNIVWTQDPVDVAVLLDPTETARVGAGGVKISYRTAQDGIGGFTDVTATKAGDRYSASLATLTPGATYDLKVWYLDTAGKEVIVEWRRFTVRALPATTSTTIPGKDVPPPLPPNIPAGDALSYTRDRSITLLATEIGGQIKRTGGSSNLTVTAGAYTGPRDPGSPNLSLVLGTPTGDAGKQGSDGFISKTLFTEIVYNALGLKTKTNEDNGLWRVFGVDANGNVVQTSLYGTQKAETDHLAHLGSPPSPDDDAPIVTYTAYDQRSLEVASFGAAVPAGRAVTRTTYDYASRALTVDEPGPGLASTYAYDGAGNLVRSADAMGYVTTMAYNLFSQLVVQTEATGTVDASTTRKVYDDAGRLREEYVVGVTDHRYYTYDRFGRQIAVANGVVGNLTQYELAYDQRDRVTSVTNGESEVTHYYYDGRDHLVWTQATQDIADINKTIFFGTAYDSMGQATHQYSFRSRSGNDTAVDPTPRTLSQAQDAVNNAASPYRAALVDEATTYDFYQNRIQQTDAEGRVRSYSYGAFGRLASVALDDGVASTPEVTTNMVYDRFGRKTDETGSQQDSLGNTKEIHFTYDDAHRLTQIDDKGTDTRTDYTYDVAGRRTGEILKQGAALPVVHSYTYHYFDNGWLKDWADSVSGIGEAHTYDRRGNVKSAVGTGTGGFSQTHEYTYDAANRVLTGAGSTYNYDARGRRAKWYDGTSTVKYTYDNADRVTKAEAFAGDTVVGVPATTLNWTYDDIGNVTKVEQSGGKSTTYAYDRNNVSYYTENYKAPGDKQSQTTTYSDKSGRVLKTVTLSFRLDEDDDPVTDTYSYTYAYNLDGTEKSVTATGPDNGTGSTSYGYDSNAQLILVNLGRRSNETDDDGDITRSSYKNETKTFKFDNRGHIILKVEDTGMRAGEDGAVEAAVTTRYLYANDDPAGEYVSSSSPKLDVGNYSVIQAPAGAWGEDGPDFPTTAIADHIVAAGETLQSIASAIYGHPELWFVIADANGLTGAEQLTAGTRLTIPNSVQYAGFATETHTLYKEGDIVGTKLPNVVPHPEEPSDCAKVAAIILIVIVAIAAVILTVVTVGAAAPAAIAALGLTAGSVGAILVGVAVGAVIGAAIAFTASVVTQLIQSSLLGVPFSWKQVAADTIAGAFGGAAAGLGAAVRGVQAASTLLKVTNFAGQTALEFGGEVTRQVVVSGRVDNWVGVGLAAGGGALGAWGSKAVKAEQTAAKAVEGAADDVARIAGKVDGVLEVASVQGKRWSTFKTVFNKNLSSQFTGFKQSAAASYSQVKNAATTVLTAPGKLLRGAIKGLRSFKDAAVDAFKSIPGALKSARQTVREGLRSFKNAAADAVQSANDWRKSGTVKTVGGWKKVVKFEKGVAQAPRWVPVGPSSWQKFKNAAADTVQSFNDWRRSGTVVGADGKKIKIGDWKKVATFNNGALAKSQWVLRESAAGTSYGARLRSTAGAIGNAIVEGAKATPRTAWKIVSSQPSRYVLSASHAYVKGDAVKVVNKLLGTSIPYWEREKVDSDRYKSTFGTNTYSLQNYATGTSKLVGTAFVAYNLYQVGKAAVDDNRRRVAEYRETLNRPAPYMANANPERILGKDSFADETAASTFAAVHDSQHSWVPTDWVNAAAASVSQILSAFPVDRAVDLSVALDSNRILAGETAKFNSASVVGLATGTVGRVATNPLPMLIPLLSPQAPSPYA